MDVAFRTWAMPAEAASVALARRRVTNLLREEGWGTRAVDDVTLMTSELVTNALEHARTPFTVTAGYLLWNWAALRARTKNCPGARELPLVKLKLMPSEKKSPVRSRVFRPARLIGGKSVWSERTPDLE